MSTLESQGTTLKIGDAASPEVFTAIGEVTSIGGPSGSATVIDTSNLSSVRREKLMGLPDEGQITVSLNWDPDDTKQTLLRTSRAARTLKNFKIEASDSPASTLSFSAFVLTFSHGFNIDGVATLEVTLEISGAITYA